MMMIGRVIGDRRGGGGDGLAVNFGKVIVEKRHPHHEKVQQREEPIAIVKIHYKTHVFISKRHFIIIWQ